MTPALSIATSVPVPIAMPTAASRERRRVVDAVAGHGHGAPLLLQALDHLALLRRQHVRLDLVDADPAGHGLGGRPRVAGEHDDAQTGVVQGANRVRRGGLDGIRDRHDARRALVDRDEHHGLPVRATGLRLRRQRAERGSPVRASARRCRRPRLRPATRPTTPVPVRESNAPAWAGSTPASFAAADHDGRGERMLAGLLESRGQPQELALGPRPLG